MVKPTVATAGQIDVLIQKKVFENISFLPFIELLTLSTKSPWGAFPHRGEEEPHLIEIRGPGLK